LSSGRQGERKDSSENKVCSFVSDIDLLTLIIISTIISAKLESGDNLTTRTKNAAKKFPTGLVANWQNKISKASDDAQLENHQRASSPLGGLEDDDAHGEPPVGNRYDEYKTRKNDVCFFYFGLDRTTNTQCGNEVDRSLRQRPGFY
jgi:hypothetical protein